MSEAKHTPGPWFVETPMESICFSIVDNAEHAYDWKMIAGVTWDDKRDREPERPFITKREAEANARLIAAAPDLLAVAKECLELAKLTESLTGCRGDDDFVCGIQQRLNAAIAKAEGRS